MKELPKYKCNRCGYTWTPRKPNPKVCADCRSPYWNSPRKNKISIDNRLKNLKKSLK